MSKLVPITIACAEYDRTRAIKDGRVRVDGCEVTYLPLGPEELPFGIRISTSQNFHLIAT
jgi:4,5-dihydroxyphthalate decarboxylase